MLDKLTPELKLDIEKTLNDTLKEYDGQLTEEGQQKMLEAFGADLTDELIKKFDEKFGSTEVTFDQGDTSPEAMKHKYGFKTFDEFAMAVKNSRNLSGDDLKNIKALDTANSGEFLIPVEWQNEILNVALDNSAIYGRCRKIPLKGNSVKIPYLINFDHYTAGQLFGGVIAYWTSEEGTITATQPKFGSVELSLEKVTMMVPVTNEFMEDAPMAVPVFLRDIMGQVLGFKLDEKIVAGNGAGEPLGFMNSAAVVEVTKETSQTAATINSENLAKMYATMYKGGKRNAIWLVGDDPGVYKEIVNAKIGESSFPAFIPAGGYGNATNLDRIHGRPAIETEHSQVVGTAGDIVFFDPTQYLLAVKQNDAPRFDSSMHLYFDTDKTAFRLVYRCDGAPWWKSSLTTKSNSSKSPIVTLAARA